LLRGSLISNVDAICPGCEMGIDLKKTDYSIGVFAQTLMATCEQTGMVVDINYGDITENGITYPDLWRFTLVDYNAGPGCLGLAVDATSNTGEPLDWEHVSANLTPACQGALDYVNQISGSSQ
jgi:hypothetical protein